MHNKNVPESFVTSDLTLQNIVVKIEFTTINYV